MRNTSTRLVALVLASAAALAGCFSDPSDDGSTLPDPNPPGSTTVLPGSTSPTPGGSTTPALPAATKQQMDQLERIVGQYARGDAPVYQGTFAASGHDVMRTGPVLASLIKYPDVYWMGGYKTGYFLTVISSQQRKRFRMTQVPESPGVTRVDMVVPFNSSFGVTGSCQGCQPDFTAHPDQITVSLVATGKYGDNSPLVIEASGELTRLPPEQLTFEHIRTLNSLYDGQLLEAVAGFTQDGALLTRTVDGSFSEPAARPPSVAYDVCNKSTRYRVEQWIDAGDLTRYGLRNYQVLSAQTCCSDGTFQGCAQPPTVCFPE